MKPTPVIVFVIAALQACLTMSARGQMDGGLRGSVYDAEFEGPVPEANISILELKLQTATGKDGQFALTGIPPGTYTLVITRDGFERMVIPGVVVTPGSMADVPVKLRGEFAELEEFVAHDMEPKAETATETGLLSLRVNTLSFQDSVSKELMNKAGASDAAAAVKLVVGTTVVDGKYASVRGLSDRYVGTAINGLRVPSSDPKKRAVQLDIFPAGTIDSISVSKTFTPDLPGDYSGGGVNIRLNSIPEEPFVKGGFSREFNRSYQNTDQYPSYEGGGVDYWARQRGERDLSVEAADMEDNELTDAALKSYHENKLDDEHPHDAHYQAYDRITRSFAPAMGIKRIRIPQTYSWNFAAGDSKPLVGQARVGGLVALSYGQKYKYQESLDTEYIRPISGSDQVTNLLNRTRETGTGETKYGMLIGAGVKRDDEQNISMIFMRARSGTDQASIRVEEYNPTNALFWEQRQAILYSERSMDLLQIKGEHKLDDFIQKGLGLRVEWFGAHNIAEQDEPDVRYFRNVVIPYGSNYIFQSRAPGSSGSDQDSSTRIWRNTKEDNSQYGLNFTVPFERDFSSYMGLKEPSDEERAGGALKFGWLADITKRYYSQQSYFYTYANQVGPLYTGPVRTQFPPGRVGTAQYNAARNAWLTSSTGITYLASTVDANADRSRISYTTNSADSLWTDAFTSPGNIGAGDRYQNSMYWYAVPKSYDVRYEGDQSLPSGYVMLEIPVTRNLKFMTGTRFENTHMAASPESDMENRDPPRAFQVAVRNPIPQPNGTTNYYYTIAGVPKDQAQFALDESHVLRASGLTYDITPKSKFRYNYAQTIARPTFLELAPVITFDYIEGVAYVGNKDLVISTVENHDLRWEWIPGDGRVLSVSYFRKDIDNPIDRESFGYLGQDYVIAVNYPEGVVKGMEFEMRAPLGAPPFLPGKFTLGANFTMIDAKVEIPEGVQRDLEAHTIGQRERDMEGQPSYLANLNLTYDVGYGTSVSAFYNHRGDMLKTGAAIGEDGATPNVYSLAMETVDYGLQQKVGKHLTFTFRIKNSTDQLVKEVYRLPDGTEILRRSYRDGTSYSFSLGGAW